MFRMVVPACMLPEQLRRKDPSPKLFAITDTPYFMQFEN